MGIVTVREVPSPLGHEGAHLGPALAWQARAQERAQGFRERPVDLRIDLHLAQAGLRDLDANLRAILLRNLLELVAARTARIGQDLAALVH